MFQKLLAFGMIAIVFVTLIKIVIWHSELLNKNSGAITSILTIILVLITAYYAWWTQALAKSEQSRFEAQFKPLIILKNPHLATSNRNAKADTDTSDHLSDESDDQQHAFHMELFIFNSPAIGLYVQCQYPRGWNALRQDYEYCKNCLSPIPFMQHDKSQKFKISLDRIPTDEQLSNHSAYIIINLWYNDRILSRHHDGIFIRLGCNKIKYRDEIIYSSTINVCYEHSDSQPARKRKMIEPLFPPNGTRIR